MVRNDISARERLARLHGVRREGQRRDRVHARRATATARSTTTGEPVATGCGTGEPAELAQGAQGGQGVHRLVLAQRHRPGPRSAPPTPIPSAADVQDIGLFVVSHVAGTLATAEFSDWSLTEIDPGAEPEPERPGAVVRRRSSPTSSTAPRSTRRAGPRCAARPTVGGGSADAARSPTATSTGANTGRDQLPRPAGAGGRLDGDDEADARAGQRVAVRRPAPARRRRQLLEGGVHEAPNDSRFFEFWSETNGSRTAHGNNVPVPAGDRHDGLRPAGRDGTQLTASYSLDGYGVHADRHRAAQGRGQDRPGRGGRRRRREPDGGVRLVPRHAGRGAGRSRLRRQVRRRGARRLPLGQDQGLGLAQPRGRGRRARRSRRSTPTSAAPTTARSRT